MSLAAVLNKITVNKKLVSKKEFYTYEQFFINRIHFKAPVV